MRRRWRKKERKRKKETFESDLFETKKEIKKDR